MKDQKISGGWLKKALVVAFLDAASMIVISFLALLLRYDMKYSIVPGKYIIHNIEYLPVFIVTVLTVYFAFRLYHTIWRFVGASDIVRIVQAYVALIPILIIEVFIINRFGYEYPNKNFLPRSYFFLVYFMNLFCCIAIRLSYRFARSSIHAHAIRKSGEIKNIMVIGGGSAGRAIVREMQYSDAVVGVVSCVIDDNSAKWGANLEGVPIVGGRYDIPEMVKKYGITEIYYAIPSAPADSRREILNICTETGCTLKALPALFQLINGEVSVSRLKDVQISDLLGRDEIKVNNSEIMEAIGGKVVMVTGGGGSIGSELCRQIAAAGPKQLIILDIYENNAYAIQQELKRKYNDDLNLVVLIGSVRNTNRVNSILAKYKPSIVFHAAAHKHVPLMEDSPNEAIKNNVMGTYKMASAAADAGVKSFLLISTDKAVNPTNIMGASKRLCEMVVQMMNRRCPNTRFMAVRFGNVLGSNGSVIPLFKKQIANGGPVTVTDKNIIRYFMTIPEAVSLVLQASYYADGGEIFVLDMGDPVRIDDMARNLIRLSGYTPDVDIKIVYTGLRPGEKLFEELLMDEEGMRETENKLIYIGRPIEMDDKKFLKNLERLDAASREESDEIKDIVTEIVPTYHKEK